MANAHMLCFGKRIAASKGAGRGDPRRGLSSAHADAVFHPTPTLSPIVMPALMPQIENPVTGEMEVVIGLPPPMQVQTASNNVILLANEVGQTFEVSGTAYTVTAVTTTNVNGVDNVTSVSLQSSADSSISTTDVVTSIAPAADRQRRGYDLSAFGSRRPHLSERAARPQWLQRAHRRPVHLCGRWRRRCQRA